MEEGKFSIKKLVAHNKLHPNTIKLLKEKKDENEGEEVVLSDDSSREAVSSDDGSSEEAISSHDDEEEEEEDASEVEEPPAKKPKAVKKEKKEKKLPWEEVIVKLERGGEGAEVRRLARHAAGDPGRHQVRPVARRRHPVHRCQRRQGGCGDGGERAAPGAQGRPLAGYATGDAPFGAPPRAKSYGVEAGVS